MARGDKQKNAHAPIRGVRNGTYIGPTGRKRKYYVVIAYNRYERAGSSSAYGYKGMKEAKKEIRHNEEKRLHHKVWLKFSVSSRKV